jgi:hypothetical protein
MLASASPVWLSLAGRSKMLSRIGRTESAAKGLTDSKRRRGRTSSSRAISKRRTRDALQPIALCAATAARRAAIAAIAACDTIGSGPPLWPILLLSWYLANFGTYNAT